jgi:tyrosinase
VVAALAPLVGKKFSVGSAFFDAVTALIGPTETKAAKSRIIAQLVRVNALWHYSRWPGVFLDQDGKVQPDGLKEQFHHHYPTADDVENILAVESFADFGGGSIYDDAFGVLDMNPHNTIHIWVGGENPAFDPARPDDPDEPATGDMLSNLTATFDPIFWGHHGNIDRLWALWQQRHPGATPDDPDDALPPFNQTVGDSYDIRALGYEYVKDSHLFLADRSAGVTRFKTSGAGVKPHVLASHRRAELKLHRVQKPMPSCVIRAFINQPDADAQTPVVGNDHYAGYIAVFDHGECVGGAGHCASPGEARRRFDQRGRAHLSPANFRLDVTACVKRLVAKGATDLDVQLVAVAPGRTTRQDLLRLEGVSLTFRD